MKLTSPIYITAANQISIQEPLSTQWFDNPIVHEGQYNESIDPQFKQWLSPGEARRLGKIMKRAVATSQESLKQSGIDNPDAIITATGLGCVKDTELFLNDLCTQGEQLLKPTQFMQSTHNTIGSLIAILNKCHGYNVTYANGDISTEIALLDALTQISLGKINNALVGAHDEMTPCYYTLLERIGYYGVPGMVTSGETAVSFMVSTVAKENALCRIDDIKVNYKATTEEIADYVKSLGPVSCVITGHNGKKENDAIYDEILSRTLPEVPVLKHKYLFGESMTASAFGIYAGAHILHKGILPQHELWTGSCGQSFKDKAADSILCINISGNNFAAVKLSKI